MCCGVVVSRLDFGSGGLGSIPITVISRIVVHQSSEITAVVRFVSLPAVVKSASYPQGKANELRPTSEWQCCWINTVGAEKALPIYFANIICMARIGDVSTPDPPFDILAFAC